MEFIIYIRVLSSIIFFSSHLTHLHAHCEVQLYTERSKVALGMKAKESRAREREDLENIGNKKSSSGSEERQ